MMPVHSLPRHFLMRPDVDGAREPILHLGCSMAWSCSVLAGFESASCCEASVLNFTSREAVDTAACP